MKIKICGITHPDDALLAAEAGADFIGIIFSEKSKRSITMARATEICAAIKHTHVKLTGVFVDQSQQEIMNVYEKLALDAIQLHGSIARAQLNSLLHLNTIFYAMTPDCKKISENLPINVIPLIDNAEAGSGKVFEWKTFTPPARCWALAGGLNHDNVSIAVTLLNPNIIDVASGVEYRDSIRKDPNKLRQFIQAAKIRRTIFA